MKHQLVRRSDMQYHVVDTKTTAGSRALPITDEVAECLKHIIETRPKLKTEPMIDGYNGFLFYDENGNPMVALHWDYYFNQIRAKYNNCNEEPLPKITPHVCRHTYSHVNYDDAKEELERLQFKCHCSARRFA